MFETSLKEVKPNVFQIQAAHGQLTYKHLVASELGDPDDYLPNCLQDSIVELSMIESNRAGTATELLNAFLELEDVRTAKLIYLDCCPLFIMTDSELERSDTKAEARVLQRLHNLYARFGFQSISADGYRRMWRIQDKGIGAEVFNAAYPYDEDNDIHPLLLKHRF